MVCPDANELARMCEGRLTPPELARVRGHIDGCARCRELVSDLARILSLRSSTPPRAGSHAEREHNGARLRRPGERLGRYVVRGVLGHGGMGVVHDAHDEVLGRPVALKSISVVGASDRSQALAEARVMAALAHPNVVAVYEVAHVDDEALIAMERIDGESLERWLARRPRTWRDVLRVFLEAAAGLAAAHAVGIVHRDFKPHNVLLARDGRVLVADFGLSALHGTDAISQGGTPMYMSPEQHRRGPCEPASDQYSFCLALHEALHGRYPFRTDGLSALYEAKTAERIDDSAELPVPAWLVAVVRRDLRADPGSRWPGMDALAAALAEGQRSAGRRLLRRLAVGGVGIGAVVVIGTALVESRRRATCRRDAASLVETWQSREREQVREAVLHSDVRRADETARQMLPLLDGYTQSWADAAASTCADRVPPAAAIDCLADARAQFGEFVTQLRAGAPAMVRNAAVTVHEIQSPRACLDDSHVLAPPAHADREEIAAIRAKLWRTQLLRQAGAQDDALAVADEALGAARRVGWPALVAEARTRRAAVLDLRGDDEGARAELEAAFLEASAAGARGVAARAADDLAYNLAQRDVRIGDALRWERFAAAELDAAGADDDVARAYHLALVGHIDLILADTDAAERAFRAAAAIAEQELGPRHLMVANIIGRLADVADMRGERGRAQELYREALVRTEAQLGRRHPRVAGLLVDMASSLIADQKIEQARTVAGDALDIYEDALGPEHPDLVLALNALASAQAGAGDETAALASYERAIGILERAGLERGPTMALMRRNVGVIHSWHRDSMREPER